MNKCKLGDVASVIISNVDKKSYENEIKIKLCNFTDVYYNWAITLRDEPKLMVATATNNEICKYKLHKGDVAITKDSETKEDIGQSTLIADEMPDMLLGYHCALIRPNYDKLSGAYLNAVMHTKLATRYFELNASGSGQRYTLSVDAINDFQLYLPSINEQERISKILTDIDRKIENNNSINDNLQQQMFIIYESMMANAAKGQITGHYIKAESITEIITGKEDANFSSIDGEYKFFTCSNVPLRCNQPAFDSASILIAGNGDFNVKHYTGKFNAYQRTYVLSPPREYYALLYLASLYRINSFKSASAGSIVKFITKGDVENIPLFIPDDKQYLDQLNSLVYMQEHIYAENEKLVQMRDWLLPMLMNGQATIGD